MDNLTILGRVREPGLINKDGYDLLMSVEERFNRLDAELDKHGRHECDIEEEYKRIIEIRRRISSRK